MPLKLPMIFKFPPSESPSNQVCLSLTEGQNTGRPIALPNSHETVMVATTQAAGIAGVFTLCHRKCNGKTRQIKLYKLVSEAMAWTKQDESNLKGAKAPLYLPICIYVSVFFLCFVLSFFLSYLSILESNQIQSNHILSYPILSNLSNLSDLSNLYLAYT